MIPKIIKNNILVILSISYINSNNANLVNETDDLNYKLNDVGYLEPILVKYNQTEENHTQNNTLYHAQNLTESDIKDRKYHGKNIKEECIGSPEYCNMTKKECVGSPEYCNMTKKECIGSPEYCNMNKKECVGSPEYCNMTKKECVGSPEYCNMTKEECVGSPEYCNMAKEECVGSPEYCNMTKEEYTTMLKDYMYPQTYEWVLIATHSIVFIVGLIGNALVCIAVYRNHTMRTVTNYFIVNLAVADFMVILFCLPPTVLWDVTETWFLGDAMCKMLLYFQSVSVTVSVLTLTFISVDRWYAICFPLRSKSTTGRAKTAIFIIWTISLIFNSPELVVLTTVQTVPLRFQLQYLVQCMATWSPHSDLVWHVIKTLFIYTVPLLLMTVAYHQIVRVLWRSNKIPGRAETYKFTSAEESQLRSRRKAAKMLVAVVIMFAVCYFPVHLLSVLRYTLDMEQSDVITCLALLSHVLCYANSAINPVIYNFMSGKFRREFRRSFCCAKSQTIENFTTLTRVTTSRRKPSDLVTFHYRHQGQGHYSTTTFIENGYHRNGCLT